MSHCDRLCRFAFDLVWHVNKTRDSNKKGLREDVGVSTGKRRAKKGEEKQADGADGWKAKAPEDIESADQDP